MTPPVQQAQVINLNFDVQKFMQGTKKAAGVTANIIDKVQKNEPQIEAGVNKGFTVLKKISKGMHKAMANNDQAKL